MTSCSNAICSVSWNGLDAFMITFRVDQCFCPSREMSPDELVYLGILAASIPVGFLFRYLSEYCWSIVLL